MSVSDSVFGNDDSGVAARCAHGPIDAGHDSTALSRPRGQEHDGQITSGKPSAACRVHGTTYGTEVAIIDHFGIYLIAQVNLDRSINRDEPFKLFEHPDIVRVICRAKLNFCIETRELIDLRCSHNRAGDQLTSITGGILKFFLRPHPDLATLVSVAQHEVQHHFLSSLDHLQAVSRSAACGLGRLQKGSLPVPGDHVADEHR